MPELNIGPPPTASRHGLMITLGVLLLLGGGLAFYYSRQVAHLSVPHVETYQTQVVFKSFSIALGQKTENDLYVMPTLRVQNGYRVPLFLQDFKSTLIFADGSELNADAVNKKDLAEVVRMFPDIRPKMTPMLDRDTEIVPGATAEGMVVLQFPISKEEWDKKKSAGLTVSFYHQAPLTVAIP